MISRDDTNLILLVILFILQMLSLYFTVPYRLKQKISRFFNPPRKYTRKNSHDIQ